MNQRNTTKQFLRSFQSRIFIAFTLLTLVIAIAFMVIMANNEIQNYRQRSREKARLLATILADSVKLPLFSGDVATLKTLADTLLETPQVAHVVIADHDQRVLVERFSKYIHSPPLRHDNRGDAGTRNSFNAFSGFGTFWRPCNPVSSIRFSACLYRHQRSEALHLEHAVQDRSSCAGVLACRACGNLPHTQTDHQVI